MATRLRTASLFTGILLAALSLAPGSLLPPAMGAAENHAAESSDDGVKALNPVDKLNPVEVKPGLTVWTVLVFVIVCGVLYVWAWGPISKALDNRERDIAGQIAEAHRRNDEAKQLLVDYEKKIAAANDEVRQIIDEGRRNSERLGQDLLDKAKQQSAAEMQRGKQQIEAATSTALLAIAQRSSELAVELAGKIVRQKLTSSDHAQLIGDAVSKFSAQASGNASNTPV